jgi:hypothetical protein
MKMKKKNNWYFMLLKAIQNKDNFQHKLGFWKSSLLLIQKLLKIKTLTNKCN